MKIGLFLQLLGNTKEAVQSYIDTIKRNLADEPSLAVATNNLIALKGPKDISDSLRKLDRLIEKGSGTRSFQLAHGLDLKLSPKQKEAIYTNRMLLLLHSNKMDQVVFVDPSLIIIPTQVHIDINDIYCNIIRISISSFHIWFL